MATSISGRGGKREGAGRPGQDSSAVRLSKSTQALAKAKAQELGLSTREVIERAVEKFCLSQ